MDSSWNLTPAGVAFLELMGQWDTDITLPVGPDGTIDFRGFYGNYEVTIDGQAFDLDLTKGDSLYSLLVAPGDYNGDGSVDAVDYTIWRDTFGSTEDLRADGNGDFVIDGEDFDVWRASFGQTFSGSGNGASSAVPEPATLAMVLLALSVTAAARRSRTSRNRREQWPVRRCRWRTCQNRLR
jgi:hypothetical protein